MAGVLEFRSNLLQAASELGWARAHTVDTVLQMAGGVPVHIALKRQMLPVGVALHWEVDSDHDAIHRVLAAIHQDFDVEYTTVDGALVAADSPELHAAKRPLEGAPA